MVVEKRTLRISARQSALAQLQAREVGQALCAAHPGLTVQYQFRESLGDQRADDPLWKMPERGVFTEDFVKDLVEGATDLVVHSWKDLPTAAREKTAVVGTLARADVRDVLLVRRDRWSKRATGDHFRILTSSPRRTHNLSDFLAWALPWTEHQVPSIEFHAVRGNIATRVRKLVEGMNGEEWDALVVAKAALDRLLLEPQETSEPLRAALSKVNFVVLPLTTNPTAAAQGALAIEVLRSRQDLIEMIAKVDQPLDRRAVEIERETLARYGGGCHQKIGVSVLSRSYGRVHFLRGLTDAGEILDSVYLERENPIVWPKAKDAAEIYASGSEPIERPAKAEAARLVQNWLKEVGRSRAGLFVARAEAWPNGFAVPVSTLCWTAGLTTWRKLAALGVWVHGSSEGLGESEEPRLDVLASGAGRIRWCRLTHAAASGARHATQMTGPVASLGTYEVLDRNLGKSELKSLVDKLGAARFYYWQSGSQFLSALDLCPQLRDRDRYHACGPGRTVETLRAHIAAKNVAVVLSRAEFLGLVKG